MINSKQGLRVVDFELYNLERDWTDLFVLLFQSLVIQSYGIHVDTRRSPNVAEKLRQGDMNYYNTRCAFVVTLMVGLDDIVEH